MKIGACSTAVVCLISVFLGEEASLESSVFSVAAEGSSQEQALEEAANIVTQMAFKVCWSKKTHVGCSTVICHASIPSLFVVIFSGILSIGLNFQHQIADVSTTMLQSSSSKTTTL